MKAAEMSRPRTDPSMAADRALTPNDAEWPQRLREDVPGAPERLFAKGAELELEKAIAVVGARHPTAAGLEATERIAGGLAEAGFTIVSGLALGIDAAAHRAALSAGTPTVAVLGCGLDVCYPARNLKLKQKVTVHGTLLSEYADGVEAAHYHFPRRNRIIAGISQAVVFVEGNERSGGLITARAALDMNRSVFAVPGSFRNPLARGPNELIRASQATLVTDTQHVLDELAPGLVWKERDDLRAAGRVADPATLDVLDERVLFLLDDAPLTIDDLCERLSERRGKVSLALARLQVRGFVRHRMRGYLIGDAGRKLREQLLGAE